jgi:hypothetical protein
MTVWNVPSANGEPEIVLVRWRVMETDTGERPLVGARDDFTGRVSTAITKFDPLRMVATTESGRIYQLRSAPGHNADAQYVWHRWCLVNGVRKFNDVTNTVYEAPKNIS